MSGDSHQSPIKTPKQLITVLVLAFVVPIVLIVLLSQLATSGRIFDKASPAMSPEEIGKRIKPVAEVAVAGGSAGAKALKTGEQVFQSVCIVCHSDRKSTRLNSSHLGISYAVFCLKKK